MRVLIISARYQVSYWYAGIPEQRESAMKGDLLRNMKSEELLYDSFAKRDLKLGCQ